MDKCEWYINEALKLFNETIDHEKAISLMSNICEIVDHGLLPKCKIGSCLETSKVYMPKAVVPFLLLLICGNSKAAIRFLLCDALMSHCPDSAFVYEYLKKNLSYFENINNIESKEKGVLLIYSIVFMFLHEGGHLYWSLAVSDDMKTSASKVHLNMRLHNSFRGILLRKFSNIFFPLCVYLIDIMSHKKLKRLDKELTSDINNVLCDFDETKVNKQDEEYFADFCAFIFSKELYDSEKSKRMLTLFVSSMLISLFASQCYLLVKTNIEMGGGEKNIRNLLNVLCDCLIFNTLRIKNIKKYLYISFKKWTEIKIIHKYLNNRVLFNKMTDFLQNTDDDIMDTNVFDMEYRFDYSDDDLKDLFNKVQTCIMNKLITEDEPKQQVQWYSD